MANNGVSQHFKIDKGLDLTSDSQFATLGANTKIVYKPSGEKYIKNPNYSNVFDKTDTFGDLETEIKSQAVRRIENSGNPDGTTNYYSIDGTKLGSFISGVSPKDLSDGLGDVKSTSISAIDDANGNGVCVCKNTSGAQIDTFTCHIPVSNHNSSLAWGQQATIGYVDGKVLTINMPGNPNTDTKYSAGTGLTQSGTRFSIDENWLKTFFNNNGSGQASGTQGWIRIGNILVQWLKISTGVETPYPYGTYASPPLGFYSFCSQNYHWTADCSDYSGLLMVSTWCCRYDQDGDNRYPHDISVMVLGVAAS